MLKKLKSSLVLYQKKSNNLRIECKFCHTDLAFGFELKVSLQSCTAEKNASLIKYQVVSAILAPYVCVFDELGYFPRVYKYVCRLKQRANLQTKHVSLVLECM